MPCTPSLPAARLACAALLLLSTLLLLAQAGGNELWAQSGPPAAADSPQPALAARLQRATAVVETDPQDPAARQLRAKLYAAAGEHEMAIADYDALLQLDPQRAEAFDERGSQHFMLGHIRQSIDDFDRYLRLKPAQEPAHWKRGISYYYAGRWDEGRRQFEGYQTVSDNDVENAVWRYLCMAREKGPDVARDAMLKIRRDTRVPMMEVYDLYCGKGGADDVLAAARAGSPSPEALNARLFYAHLYLGLYHEVAGNAALAREHITTAARQHKIGHYMWNVADVHARLLEQAAEKKP
jgi:lipoprotein NlpI